MLRNLLIITVLASAPAVARTVSSPLTVETDAALFYELRDGGKPAVMKLWRPRSTATSTYYSDRKSLVTVTLATGADRTPARELNPRWSDMITVAGEITTTSGCEFRSGVANQVTGLQGHGGKAGLTFGGGGATICTFTMFVPNEKLEAVLETLKNEERPIVASFEPLVVRTTEDIEVRVPLDEWYESLRRYSRDDLGQSEAVFALGFTAAKVPSVSDRLPDLGQNGLGELLGYVRSRFFDVDGERLRVRGQDASTLGDYSFTKTIVTGEQTYVF